MFKVLAKVLDLLLAALTELAVFKFYHFKHEKCKNLLEENSL